MRVKRRLSYGGFLPGDSVVIRKKQRAVVGAWLPPGDVVPLTTEAGEFQMTLAKDLRRSKP
jgi:hypothetical protein